MKRKLVRLVCLICSAATVFYALSCFAATIKSSAYENTGKGAADIAETAKAEIGYSASAGTTKYIQWIASSQADRASSFISWCAYTAGISTDIIPRAAKNADILTFYRNNGLFKNSAYLSGTEKPQIGSLIFITSSAGSYSGLKRVGIVTEIYGMTVSFIEDGYNNSVCENKCSIYNASVLGYAFPAYNAAKAYESGLYMTEEVMNFRTGPDSSYTKVQNSSGVSITIPTGTSVTVTEVNGNWGLITYLGKSGWMCLDWSVFIGAPAQPKDGEWTFIDIARFQPESAINWSEIKKAGVSGVIIRIGGRCYGPNDNSIYDDTEFAAHYEGAKKAGLYVGTYFFSAAYTKEEAQEEAQFVIDRLKKGNYRLDLPVFIDIEDIEANYKPHYVAGKKVCTLVADSFCELIESKGYYAGIYCSKDFAEVLLEPSVFTGRAVWIAQYNKVCTYSGFYHMWQYTSTGRIPGYNGLLDVSKCYYDLAALIRSEGYNGFVPTGEYNNDSDWVVTVSPSCKAYGEEVIYDKNGSVEVRRETDRLSHSTTQAVVIGKQITAGESISARDTIPYATYITNKDMQSSFLKQGGSIIEYCVNCSIVTETEYTPASACKHTAAYEKTKRESTCSVQGVSIRYCPDCKCTLSSHLMPLSEHNTVMSTIAATCTKQGSTTTKCKVCGAVVYQRMTGYASHVGEWKVVRPARALVSGLEECVCSVCGKKVTREIDALLLGDLDYDGKISASDARSALRMSVGLDKYNSILLSVADIDNDLLVTSSDARLILRLSVKLESYEKLVEAYHSSAA